MFSHLSKQNKHKLLKLLIVFVAGIIYLLSSKYFEYKNRSSIIDSKVAEHDKYNTVHFLDVGQGDCTLFETFDGKFAVIDTSHEGSSDKIISYLNDIGVEEIEYLILTHPHSDHIGGGDNILESFRVNNIIMSERTETTSSYKRLINEAKESKKEYGTKIINPETDDNFSLGNISFTVISDGKDYENLNSSSICFIAECGKSTFLFTGDAEKDVERDLLDSGVILDAEVYKSAHHGSTTSNLPEFVDSVNPDICIISCGKDNDYGHPHREIVEYLEENKIDYYITHRDGDITLLFDENSILQPSL